MNKRPYQIMTHIVAGYPTLAESEAIALAMIETGIDYLEIQIPFTDPVADGPVISAANHISLDNGTAVQDCMNLMKSLRAKTDIPLYFMTYYNIPFVYGLERFCAEAKSAGATGIICPDMPYDEEKRNGYFAQCQKYNLQAILVVSPLTSEERLKHIGEVSKGVIYCVAGSGTTGAERTFDSEMKKYLELAIKENSFYLLPRYMLAEYYEINKDTAAAIAEYDKILDINPENVELFNYVG